MLFVLMSYWHKKKIYNTINFKKKLIKIVFFAIQNTIILTNNIKILIK